MSASEPESPDDTTDQESGETVNDDNSSKVIRTVIPRRPKLDSSKILDDPNGVSKLLKDFPTLPFRENAIVSNLDLLMTNFKLWAAALYPFGLNVLDFANTVESELQTDDKRKRLFGYRAGYLKDLSDGSKGSSTCGEASARERSEANRLKAIERRSLKESNTN